MTRTTKTHKAAVALSPTNETLAHNLMWDYDPAKAFTRDSPEILTNDLYQDQQISIEQ